MKVKEKGRECRSEEGWKVRVMRKRRKGRGVKEVKEDEMTE